MEYLGRFLDSVDAAQSGKAGAISEDKWLLWNHSPEFSDILSRHLDHGSSRVRAETITLLTKLKDPDHAEKVAEMRRHDTDVVAAACVGYLASFESRNRLTEELMEELRTGYGQSFKDAAKAMVPIASKKDIPELRRIMSEVDRDRSEMVKEILMATVDRNPELWDLRDGVLSSPIPPDAEAYNTFLDKAFNYIDVRYRRNVHPLASVEGRTMHNVQKSLRSIASRHYLESENLPHYSEELSYEHHALGELISWCSSDIESKDRGRRQKDDPSCPGCTSPMRMYKGQWYCPGCGTRREA